MNDEELISRIAHHMDPLVFDHEGSQPPSGFIGSPEWWATAKHSRRKRVTEAATEAVQALRVLGYAILPRMPTAAMTQAGAECLVTDGRPTSDPARSASEVWNAMLAMAEQHDESERRPPSTATVMVFPPVIRRGA